MAGHIFMATAQEMDRMYRRQRHIYDFTRKYYLLGRDRLLREMELRPGDRVIEIGCGTARNLVRLARLRPGLHLYGLDASAEMLVTAHEQVRRHGFTGRIVLHQGLAECMAPAMFGLAGPFDAAFFSYSLSMIPTWREAIDAALAQLKPGGILYLVDFWDQGGWPRWFRALLGKWLALFHVEHRPGLLAYLHELESRGEGRLTLQAVAGRYAFLARFQKENPAGG